MTKEQKQIAEIAKVLCEDYGMQGCEKFCPYSDCFAEITAEELYNAGYRKASDVAAEIFAEIKQKIAALEYNAKVSRKTVTVETLMEQVNWVLHEVVPETLAELKKKYESEGE